MDGMTVNDECRVVSVVTMYKDLSGNDMEVAVHIMNTDMASNKKEVVDKICEAIKMHMLG
jgi:hypothetical protein